MTEWYERWFGDEYLRLYPHRNDEDARQAVDLVAAHIELAGRRVLDLACGPGRHAVQLVRRGAHVVGLDLSRALLHRARELGAPVTGFVRADMRALPFRDTAFDVAVNLFTSFGYFSDDRDHVQVLRGTAAALAPRGAFVLDYLNAPAVRQGLVPREEKEIGGEPVVIERHVTADGRFVVKDLRLVREERSFEERVRLFSHQELRELLAVAGFRMEREFGAYDGRALDDAAPRAIFFARRS